MKKTFEVKVKVVLDCGENVTDENAKKFAEEVVGTCMAWGEGEAEDVVETCIDELGDEEEFDCGWEGYEM